MKDKSEIPPEIALLLEKRELEDRRASAVEKAADAKGGQAESGDAKAKNIVERRRRNRRKS
jgi:hypothetical protein